MIVVKLTGGLGNQLFQYAAGTALAKAHGVDLALDLGILPLDGRAFGLKAFHIEAKILPNREPDLPPSPVSVARVRNAVGRRVERALERIDARRPWYMQKVAVQPHFHFAEDFFKIGPSGVLQGYWQSPKYFSAIEPLIREQFKLAPEYDQPSKWDSQLARPDSVGLHVRRGDYVSNPVFAKRYRVMDRDYYQAALDILREKIGKPKIFVFSDDLPWCEENLNGLGDMQFVDGGSDLGDFRLMGRCTHHIISNSTFAWWAAWRGASPLQQVVAPKSWFFNDNKLDDLFPANWALVKSDLDKRSPQLAHSEHNESSLSV